mmetsp:Transcript_17848/g.49947  ORF Transcript_17848/g.49947 Transcript_17848/m.49947 type:complete len:246 (+) Transcript_17848:432-1169(+)
MRSLSPVSRARLMVSADILPAPTSTSAAAMIRTILNRKFSPSTFSSSSSGPLSSVISIFVTVRTVVPSRRELLLVSRKARKSCVPTSSPAAERMATISRRKDSPAAGRRLFEAHHRRPTHHWNCLFIGSGVILQHILYIYRFPEASQPGTWAGRDTTPQISSVLRSESPACCPLPFSVPITPLSTRRPFHGPMASSSEQGSQLQRGHSHMRLGFAPQHPVLPCTSCSNLGRRSSRGSLAPPPPHP